MNDEIIHKFFSIFTSEFQLIEVEYELQKDQYDEFILGAAAALFNIYRFEANNNDALEFSDFLKRLNELSELHIKSCKEGEQMHKIKCEHCGNDIERSQLYIVIFHGVMIDVHTQHLCCKSCLKDIEKDLRATFTPGILNKCLSCYHLEIVSAIEEEGENNVN